MSITLPSGKAKFNWVDIEDIAESTAKFIVDFSNFQGQSYDITGEENKTFASVVSVINEKVENKITYNRVGPIKFYFLKKREGMKAGLIVVMLVLHYLPRFQKEPLVSNNVKLLTGHNPTTIKEFIEREHKLFA